MDLHCIFVTYATRLSLSPWTDMLFSFQSYHRFSLFVRGASTPRYTLFQGSFESKSDHTFVSHIPIARCVRFSKWWRSTSDQGRLSANKETSCKPGRGSFALHMKTG